MIRRTARDAGVDTTTWNQMMRDDLRQLADSYANMGIPYQALAPVTDGRSGQDGNCNVYTAYVLRNLGGPTLPGGLTGFPGMGVIHRDEDGRVWLDSHSRMGSFFFSPGNVLERIQSAFSASRWLTAQPNLSETALP